MPDADGPAFDTLAAHAGLSSRKAGSEGCLDWRTALEERLAALEGGSSGVAVTSGRAAHLLVLRTLCRPGDEILVPRRIGGASADQLAGGFASFGWRSIAADAADADSFAAAVSPRTKAILVESLGEDGGAVTDLAEISAVARRAGVPMIVDNTLATPALCRPLEFGADIVVHSTAEFIAGDPGIAGGVIVDGGVFDWAREGRYPVLSEPQHELDGASYCRRFGNYAFAMACRRVAARFVEMPVETARQTLAGTTTLTLRMRRQSETAAAIAERLAARRDVKWVNYAGLSGHRHHNLARRYLGDLSGALLTFGLDRDRSERLTAATKLLVPNDGVGGSRSSLSLLDGDPASGRKEGALRLSVGLECAADLIADLEQAVNATS
jgi:O-acetylhomoserine (thiol)-lyase